MPATPFDEAYWEDRRRALTRKLLLTPTLFDLPWLGINYCFWSSFGWSWWLVLLVSVAEMLAWRLWGVASFEIKERNPRLGKAIRRVESAVLALLLAACAGWIGFQLLQARHWYRFDLRGALFMLLFGAVSLAYVGPPYWLFTARLKPWTLATGRHFAGAGATIVFALSWWAACTLALTLVLARL